MTVSQLSQIVLSFLAYGFLGWIMESFVLLIHNRRFTNAGFLSGPVVPIYGFGALAILILTEPIHQDPLLVFAAAVVAATVVEFVGHLVLEKLLGLVLWDYSGHFANLQGRVCLANSLGFGLMGMIIVYVLDPWLASTLASLDEPVAIAIASGLGSLVTVDFARSVLAVANARPEVEAAAATLSDLRGQLEARIERLADNLDTHVARQRAHVLRRSESVIHRLARAFPLAHLSGGARTDPKPTDGGSPMNRLRSPAHR
jgi:uncharacterized membrane protein